MKRLIFFIIFLIYFIASGEKAYAHKMIIEPTEPGIVRVMYEDGSFSKRTVVIILDENGNEVESGKLDDNGFYQYDTLKAKKIIANDGIGHKIEWEIGSEIMITKDSHKIGYSIIVVGLCIIIAIFFSYRVKRKKKNA